MRRGVALAALLLLAAAAPAAGGARLPVVATSTDLEALVEAVGGERVAVQSLAPPLQDPHAVDLKPGQIARLKTAVLLVRVGLDHEPWLAKLLLTAGNPAVTPGGAGDLDASRSVRLLQTETPRVRDSRGVHVHALGNPHYWLDPENARPITAAIAEALGRLSPADRPTFAAKRAAFLARLDAGLQRWTETLAPHRGARVVVVHDSWPYFAARFGLSVVAAVESAPGVPPAPSAIATLTERMRAAGVRVLIAEPYSNTSLVRQLAARAGARAVTLVPSVGGDPAAADYLSLFDLNVARLAQALAAR